MLFPTSPDAVVCEGIAWQNELSARFNVITAIISVPSHDTIIPHSPSPCISHDTTALGPVTMTWHYKKCITCSMTKNIYTVKITQWECHTYTCGIGHMAGRPVGHSLALRLCSCCSASFNTRNTSSTLLTEQLYPISPTLHTTPAVGPSPPDISTLYLVEQDSIV